MVLNDVMSRQGSLWPQSRLGWTPWQAGKWEQGSIHQGLESREQSYLIFPTASLPSALYWEWQKKMICADQSLAHQRPVVAAACLKGATDRRSPTTWLKACDVSLTFRLRDDCHWVTNTSWLRYKARILTFRFTRLTRGTDVTIGKDAWQQQPVRQSSRGQETSAYRPPMLTRLTTSACFYISGPALAFPWLAITIKEHLLAVALFALHSPWPVFHLHTVNKGATVWGGCELCVFSTRGWHTREHMSPPTAG